MKLEEATAAIMTKYGYLHGAATALFLVCQAPVHAQNSPPAAGASVAEKASPPVDNAEIKLVPPVVPSIAVPQKKAPPVAQKALPAKKATAVDALRPGQFVWEDRAIKEADTRIVVVLNVQRLYVFQNSKLVAFSTISSGKKGHETPPGIFPILEKDLDHKSSLYDDAPMPFMQRLTWDGVAMHAGHNPGFPASHGCVRLPAEFAKRLFNVTKYGQRVIVMRDVDTPPPAPAEVKPIEPATPANPLQPAAVPAPTPAPVIATPVPTPAK